MSIPLAQGQVDSSLMQLAAVLGCIGISISIAAAAEVFRGDSVNGPPRVAAGERLTPIWMSLLIALGVWILAQQLYVSSQFLAQPESGGTTLPATQPVLSGNQQVVMGIIAFTALLSALIISHIVLRPGGLKRLGFGLSSLAHAIWPGIVGIAIVLPLMYVTQLVMAYLTTLLPQEALELLGLKHSLTHPLLEVFERSAKDRSLVIMSAVLLAPLAEELLFRGLIQTGIAYTLGAVGGRFTLQPRPIARWMAIFLTSIAFAMVHPGLWMMPPIFLLSIFMGYAYERTGNLWVPILIHVAFNGFNIILKLLNT